MAIRFLDSVAHYNGTGLAQKWTAQNFTNWNPAGGNGRRGAPYLSGIVTLQKTLTHQSRYMIGAAIALNTAGAGGRHLTMYNDTTLMAYVNVEGDGTVSIFSNGQRLANSTLAVPDNTSWHYYELDAAVSGGTGTCSLTATVRVDGRQYVTYSGTTNILGTNLINGSCDINGVGCNASNSIWWMDFYALDTNATDANGFSTTNTGLLGDISVEAVFPNSDATPNQWTMTGGTSTNHWTTINDNPPDFDTSYLSTTNTASNNVEKHTYQPISGFTGTILGVQYSVLARKDAEGLRQIALTVGTHTASTIEFQGTSNYLSDYYVYYIAPLDSDFGSPWGTASFGTSGETFGFACIG